MNILITGAAGGIGRKMIERLQGEHELLLTDAAQPSEASVFDHLAPGGRRKAPLDTEWPYLRADLLDSDALDRFVRQAEVIIHLAGIPTGDWDKMDLTMRTNALGTSRVLDLARKAGVRRFVNASSINAFGTFWWRVSGLKPIRRKLPLTEDEPPIPEDPYSLTKFLAEEIGHAYQRAFGIEVVNLRFAGVRSDALYRTMLSDGLPVTETFPADLGQWVHEDDVAAGIELGATVPMVTSEPIVLAAGDTKLPEPTLEIIRRFQPDLQPHVTEPLPGRTTMLSITRARIRLGYSPKYNLDGAAIKTG